MLVEGWSRGVELTCQGRSRTAPGEAFFADAASLFGQAAELVFGKAPVVSGVSAEGTILKHVWMPTVLTGFAQPDCNLHAPNESVDLDHYIKGCKYAAAIMWFYGKSIS